LKALRLLKLLVIFSCISSNIFSQPKNNLELIQELSRKNIDSLFSSNRLTLGDTLNIKMIPSTNSWIVEHEILKELKEKNIVCFQVDSNSSPYTLVELAIPKMDVRYEKMFRDGFLGAKKIVRSVELELSAKIMEQSKLLDVGQFYQRYQDTVSLEAVNQLEDEHVTLSKGILPDEAIFDRIISPVILTSSVAVIVYLFFTLRK
jgi:hypothetical protein